MNPRRHALTLAPAALAVALGGHVRLSSFADGALLAGVVAADKARVHGGAPRLGAGPLCVVDFFRAGE